MGVRAIAFGKSSVPFAEEASAIPVLAKNVGVKLPGGFRSGLVWSGGSSEATTSEPSQYAGSAYPTDGVAYQRIGKTGPLLSQTINHGSLHNGVTVATQGTGSLIICEKENNIGLFLRSAKEERLREDEEQK